MMFSNMASIFAMTSRASGRRAEAIEDETDSQEQVVVNTEVYSFTAFDELWQIPYIGLRIK